MLLRRNSELVVHCVMQDLLCIIPVLHHTMCEWSLQAENTALALRLIANVGILLAHSNHDRAVSAASNNGWEYCSGCIITCKACFGVSGAHVDDHSHSSILIRILAPLQDKLLRRGFLGEHVHSLLLQWLLRRPRSCRSMVVIHLGCHRIVARLPTVRQAAPSAVLLLRLLEGLRCLLRALDRNCLLLSYACAAYCVVLRAHPLLESRLQSRCRSHCTSTL
mmetsp:Transcript_61452/g.146552  ORF Transcript_61452/g.146552 Transcript_61452/m.146552 type:complete len:221 (+) Transcript_61452:3296-3958(+)